MSITSAQALDGTAWKQAAERAQPRIETRLFIDGEYVDAVDKGRFASVNPANGEVVAEMAAGTSKDIDRAVASARRAREWRSAIASPTSSTRTPRSWPC